MTLYLRAALHRLLRLPPPHVHDWHWGPTQQRTAYHHGEGADHATVTSFSYAWQEGRCRGCGAEKTRRVW